MGIHHNFDPIAMQLGPLTIRWYGLMYLVGIIIAWFLGNYRLKYNTNPHLNINKDQFSDLIIYIVFGLLVGGRLGYMMFYQTQVLLSAPSEVLMLWHGGMSFHGGLIGAILAILLYCYKTKQNFFVLADFMAPLAPPAFFFGRLGNFINGELWGKPTDMPWGVIFPSAGDLPRHPSQLYEGMLEGIVLFIILWQFTKKPRPMLATSGVFFLCYGAFRTFIEFYRIPDKHIGYLAFDWLTMGQLLSLPMIMLGLVLLIIAYSKNHAKIMQ
jgi:phosphatidylglycerol:prolipoprotein diacylglycerol transferase